MASKGGGDNIYIFLNIRDMTFKHKYQYFYIYQRYANNLHIYVNIHRDKQLFELVKVLVSKQFYQGRRGGGLEAHQ